jgi:uncharacterized protein with ATP-grasp and redox domains
MSIATDVSICSNALLMLGDNPIAALSPPDPTDAGTLCANLYPQVREWVLRKHSWNCAVKRVILAPDVLTAAEQANFFDYAYRFSIPDDWLRTLQVGQKDQGIDYQQEGRKFLADESVFYLVYVFHNKVEATFDSLLVEVLTAYMKAALAYPITKSASMRDSCLAELERVLKMARAIDGLDNPPDTLGDFRLFSAGFMSSF